MVELGPVIFLRVSPKATQTSIRAVCGKATI